MNEDSEVKHSTLKLTKEEIKEELKCLSIMIIVILIILKIAFYKDTIFNAIKFGLAFIYFSLLPGYFILFNFREHMSRNIRFVMAFPVGFAIYAITAYYLNIFINLKYLLVIPLLIVIFTSAYYYYKLKKQK